MDMTQEREKRWMLAAVSAVVVLTVIGNAPWVSADPPGDDLGAVESAFAATMAERDLAAERGRRLEDRLRPRVLMTTNVRESSAVH